MRDLRVTLVQSMLHWEDVAANISMFSHKLEGLEGKTDLIVLPEMFNTGFTMRSDIFAEVYSGTTVTWMAGMAKRTGSAIYGSVIIKEQDKYFNRGVFVHPHGRTEFYDKRHLFRMAGEHEHFSAGRRRVIVEHLGWRILLQVCYDLRFPVFSRNRNDHDLVLYVANWPAARRSAWNALLPARAVENLSYVAAVNRVGMDGRGNHYAGESMIVGPLADRITFCAADREEMVTAVISAEELMRYREKFPAHLDADQFTLKDVDHLST